MVFGAFDGLHPGHINFFEQAKKYGDFLIVSVGRDKVVRKFKGKLPLFNEQERLSLISKLSIVDLAILGAQRDYYKHVRELKPDVVCLGYDQWVTESEVRENLQRVGLNKTVVIRLKPYKASRAKSSILKVKAVGD